MKKKVLFPLFLSILFSNSITAQTFETEKSCSYMKLSFSNLVLAEDHWFEEKMIDFQLEYHYLIIDFISIGVYSGLGFYDEWSFEKMDYRISREFLNIKNSILYGLVADFHVLPLFIKDRQRALDLYISGKLGGNSFLTTKGQNIIPQRGNYLDYSISSGVALYGRIVGIHAEVGYRKCKYINGISANFGLSFRF